MTEHNFAMIELKTIRIDGGTQQRPLSQEALEAYEERHRAGEEFPAVKTVFDGKDHWLWDGFHRYHVARKVGDTVIMAEVTQGTARDAVWISFSANKDHGVQRPRECLSEIIKKILCDPEWSKVSHARIAQHVGVTAALVCKISASINRLIDAQGTHKQGATKEVTRSGKTYTMKVGRIGRQTSKKPGKQSMKTIRTGRPMLAKTALDLPHDPASAANTLISFFDRPFIEGLVTELSRYLQTQGE